jgi:hypothetical protein
MTKFLYVNSETGRKIFAHKLWNKSFSSYDQQLLQYQQNDAVLFYTRGSPYLFTLVFLQCQQNYVSLCYTRGSPYLFTLVSHEHH